MSWRSSVQWSWQRLFMWMPRRKKRSWLQPNSTNGMFHGFSVNYIFYYIYRINLCGERNWCQLHVFQLIFNNWCSNTQSHTQTEKPMWVAETQTRQHLQCNWIYWVGMQTEAKHKKTLINLNRLTAKIVHHQTSGTMWILRMFSGTCFCGVGDAFEMW